MVQNSLVYISSTCSRSKRIGYVVSELADLGFRSIELSGGTEFYEEIESDLFRLKEKYAIEFLIHNFFPPPKENFILNLTSPCDYIYQQSMDLIKKAISLSQKLGNNLYTIHSGFDRIMKPNIINGYFSFEADNASVHLKNSRDVLYKRIDSLVNDSLRNNFRLGIENMFPYKQNDRCALISDEDEIAEFFTYYKHQPYIGLLLDLGHLNVAANRLSFDKIKIAENIINNYTDKIFAIHISENDGTHDSHKTSEYTSWQVELLKRHKNILKDIPKVLEWRAAANKDTYRRFRTIQEELTS